MVTGADLRLPTRVSPGDARFYLDPRPGRGPDSGIVRRKLPRRAWHTETTRMRFEHFAINVANPAKVAAWYVERFGVRILRALPQAPFTHFLGDSEGRVFLELYENPKAPVGTAANKHYLEIHFGFAVADAESAAAPLIAEGCPVVEDVNLPDGTRLIMLRDPFGLCVQLCQRAKRFL
ncbi:MAG TPA: VOC family protein [Opitutaceae bacterium]